MSVVSPYLSLLDLVYVQGMCRDLYIEWNIDDNYKWGISLGLEARIESRFHLRTPYIKKKPCLFWLRSRVRFFGAVRDDMDHPFICFGGCGRQTGRQYVVSYALCKFACCVNCYITILHPDEYMTAWGAKIYHRDLLRKERGKYSNDFYSWSAANTDWTDYEKGKDGVSMIEYEKEYKMYTKKYVEEQVNLHLEYLLSLFHSVAN